MVALRSTRQDRTLLIVLWLFTVLVLVLGGIVVNPILLVWGTVGLLAAVFLTRIHLRDTRARSGGDARPDGAAFTRENAGGTGQDATGPDSTERDETGQGATEQDAEESR